jgi:hypothetical protein
MVRDVAIAAAIVIVQLIAALLFVLGAECVEVQTMNAAWVVAAPCLYMPIGWAARAYERRAT